MESSLEFESGKKSNHITSKAGRGEDNKNLYKIRSCLLLNGVNECVFGVIFLGGGGFVIFKNIQHFEPFKMGGYAKVYDGAKREGRGAGSKPLHVPMYACC